MTDNLLGHVIANCGHPTDDTRLGFEHSVLRQVEAEIRAQKTKWGQQNHAPSYWLAILGEEYGEICRAFNEGDENGYINELIQTAAVCISQAACFLQQTKIEGSPQPEFQKPQGAD